MAGSTSGRTRNSILPTRLTQPRRTEAKGKIWVTTAELPTTEHSCRGCGMKIATGRLNCANCAVDGATEQLAVAAKLGRLAAQRPEARAKHVASHKRHAQAESAWNTSKQPAWLTSEVFSQQIQPLLANTPTSQFDHELVSRDGMQAESAKAIAPIRGTGRRWPIWLALGRRSERSARSGTRNV